jgi:N-acetylglutamate synthase-like GNAT family acetyltransferase
MNLTLKTPTDIEFKQVCEYIHEFELDNRELKREQFIVAFRHDELVGFGRLRAHADCLELCSLGVVTPHRKQGIGKAIVTELIKKSSKNIYLVCIIPEYFEPFGFKNVSNYPSAIQDKIDYCTNELIVPERYVAMLLER